MSGRWVTLNTQQTENNGALRDIRSWDIPPHLAWHEGCGEAREAPWYEQGLFGQRYQNLPPLLTPGGGGGGGPGGGSDPSDDNDDDRRHCHEHREVHLAWTSNHLEWFNQLSYTAQNQGLTPGMSGYTDSAYTNETTLGESIKGPTTLEALRRIGREY